MPDCRKTLLCLLVLLSACQADDTISRAYRCYFVFDTLLHPQPCQLTAILGNSGHFCKIETSQSNGARHLKTTRNYDGATEDILLSTAREAQTACLLGANNCIIVGTSAYDNRLVAYDGQCPNCLSAFGGLSYPLAWQHGGLQLHCAKCGRSYDISNGTIVSGDGGHQLSQYYAAFDGQLLRAWN